MNNKTFLVSIFLLLNCLSTTAHYLLITNYSGFILWGGFNVEGDLSEYEYDKERILVIQSKAKALIKIPACLQDDHTFQLNFLYPNTSESASYLTYRIGDIKNQSITIGNKEDSGATEEDLSTMLKPVSKKSFQRLAARLRRVSSIH